LKKLLLFLVLLAIASSTVAAPVPIPLFSWEGELNYAALGFFEFNHSELPEVGFPLIIWQLDSPGGIGEVVSSLARLIHDSPVPVVLWTGAGRSLLADEALLIAWEADRCYVGAGSVFGVQHAYYLNEIGELIRLQDGLPPTQTPENGNLNSTVSGTAQLLTAGFLSLNAEELVTQKLVDGSAEDSSALLQQIIKTDLLSESEEYQLATTEGDLLWRIIETLSEPSVAFVLFLLALLSFSFAGTTPRTAFAIVFGAAILLLALIAFSLLPITTLGLLLVIGAMVAFTLELLLDTGGLSLIAGMALLFFGGVNFYRPETVSVSPATLVPTLAIIGVFFGFSIRSRVLSRFFGREPDPAKLIGQTGVIISPLSDKRRGRILLHGELWWGRSTKPLHRGQAVRVLNLTGRTFDVEAAQCAAPQLSD